MDSLPTPPNEEHARPQGLKRSHAASKPLKTVHRTLKRTSTHSHPPSPARESHSQHGDGRHKRVWKACERCRMKKTKCDGEFPCKRCKDDGLICTAGTRKKTEYKQLPPGYAEVLENTQFVLIATVQKLYSMVRNGEPWELGEPELNDRGQPVIHNVAAKLGCLRPNTDLDLPIHSIFPEDEAGMTELARQLQDHAAASTTTTTGTTSQGSGSSRQETESNGIYNRTDRASSSAASDAEHSDLDHEPDYRRAAFGAASAVSMSPASLGYPDFEISPPSAAPSDGFPPSQHSPTVPVHPHNFQWMGRPSSMDFTTQQLWMASQGFMNTEMMTSGVLGSTYATKPAGFSSSCRNPEVMMGMGDPVIFSSGYEEDKLGPLFPNSNI
ncbi:hypothetical protein CHGG_06395 [Chaetomium globosum CBS 148.51]|uniref:Zn(2)-C6 fungal-type domain-containing protein n=1 Tax=Chaetomium globosum (strain ATCC 6205 / CBS 148.51 / DSM 1962 / NBRC 6347 / NRRL 1970) TaxID=306901 RepID=Q2H4M0_CHAGB|nr:uncharacterized protein CHGG_06395 [Chaetomium globosum CBS 148.51]EAQ89776.1 hypothetical protein CHGG_06395 [Chaetomium globosum CBS 148.51]